MSVQFPEAFRFLFEPARYKVAYGGRGSGKSWAMARAALLASSTERLRWLCARELQKSIKESVHQLLAEQVKALGLESVYEVRDTTISGRNGSDFIFAGLKHNINSIKSIEGVNRVWVEEGQTVSKGSWDTLIPTIRAAESEIWCGFNPALASDDTYQRFIVNPPTGAVVRKVNYTDNPWFPDVLRQEMEDCRARSEDDYQHIWLGCCKSYLDGAIYANELRAVDRENRVLRVQYDASKPVHTFWDIGVGDQTAIWFVQSFPFEYRLIDYLEHNQQGLPWYLQQIQAKGYVYGTHYLPWDAQPKQFGTGKSVQELAAAAGIGKVSIVPKLSVADGINAARTIFPQCFFDAERCADGLQALRHYRYGESNLLDDKGKPLPTKTPLHDQYSHGADAFRYLAVGIKAPPAQAKKTIDMNIYSGPSGWMA
jgi:phage terminase large subunit